MLSTHGSRILGLDLGKFKTATCLLDTATGEASFATVSSTPQTLRSHLAELAPDHVVLEACPMAGWVSDLARELSGEVQVAHVGGEAWKWDTLKRKTDRDDALKLAKLSAMGEISLVHVPDRATRQRRALIRHRKWIVGEITKVKNQVYATLLREGISWAGGRPPLVAGPTELAL